MHSIARRLAHLDAAEEPDAPFCARDTHAALRLLQTCIDEQGHYAAMYDLAVMLSTRSFRRHGVRLDVRRAAALFHRCAVEAGNFDAMRRLADILLRGASQVRRDVPRAVQLYEACVYGNDDAEAMSSLVECVLDESLGVRKDGEYVVQLCRSLVACRQSCGDVRRFAQRVQVGKGSMVCDVALSARMFQICVDGNDVMSLFYLGRLVAIGAPNADVDMERALQLFKRFLRIHCNDRDEVSRVRGLADQFAAGTREVSPNAACAAQIYELCINEGNDVKSMIGLAKTLATGADGVKEDATRAVQLCEHYLQVTADTDKVRRLGDDLGMQRTHLPIAVQLYSMCVGRVNDDDLAMSLAKIVATGTADVKNDAVCALRRLYMLYF